jgi:hypothetical protein
MGCMDRIELAQGRDRRREIVNAVINNWVPESVEGFLTR